jgi:hypothetical protein
MHQNLWGYQFGKENLGMLLFFVKFINMKANPEEEINDVNLC